MEIKKGAIVKNEESTVVLYPKTSADMVQYDENNTVEEEIVFLLKKVDKIKQEIDNIQTQHINNDTIHVTEEDRKLWNNNSKSLTCLIDEQDEENLQFITK